MTTTTSDARGLKEGYRSGLEDKVAAELRARGIDPHYEEDVLSYLKPARQAKYHPDFKIYRKDGSFFYVETKGRFVTADRQKHLLVKSQRPDIEIRFVFSNPNQRISKQSKTTYAMWCQKNGFLFAARSIPEAWLNE